MHALVRFFITKFCCNISHNCKMSKAVITKPSFLIFLIYYSTVCHLHLQRSCQFYGRENFMVQHIRTVELNLKNKQKSATDQSNKVKNPCEITIRNGNFRSSNLFQQMLFETGQLLQCFLLFMACFLQISLQFLQQ